MRMDSVIQCQNLDCNSEGPLPCKVPTVAALTDHPCHDLQNLTQDAVQSSNSKSCLKQRWRESFTKKYESDNTSNKRAKVNSNYKKSSISGCKDKSNWSVYINLDDETSTVIASDADFKSYSKDLIHPLRNDHGSPLQSGEPSSYSKGNISVPPKKYMRDQSTGKNTADVNSVTSPRREDAEGDDIGDCIGDIDGSASDDGSDVRHQCDICFKSFAVPARLVRHRKTHTGEKPFSCEFCPKTFSVKENLNVHRRIHTKERPYTCAICSRAFEHSGKLHRHTRTHTGERPHKCEVCMKTFVQSGQLVIHMRAHTGERPYSCEYCSKAFTCSKQLKVHLRTHTGEKPYGCDVCGKTFGYNHVLKMHKMSHLAEKMYKCTLCDQFFSKRTSLDSHIKEHSGDTDTATSSSVDLAINRSNNSDTNNNNVNSYDIVNIENRAKKGLYSKKKHLTSVVPKESKKKKRDITSKGRVKDCFESASANIPDRSSPCIDYISDDSGCEHSPVVITPPISPGVYPTSSPLPSSPPQYQSLSSSQSPPIVLDQQPQLPHPTPISSADPLPSYSHYSLNISVNTIENHSSVRQQQLIVPNNMPGFSSYSQCSQAERLIDPNYNHSSISTSSLLETYSKLDGAPKLAVFTTQSGERLACPVHLLVRLNDAEDYTSINSRLKKELERQVTREELRRVKESTFCQHVIKVLFSLLGSERMSQLGYPNVSIDHIIRNTLHLMKIHPCTEPSLASIDRIKVNLRLLLDSCVPEKEMWDQFGWKGKSIEDIVSEFVDQCSNQHQ
uniref:Krueppel homolog 1-like n=2 Tax=Hirondellea gigas TaxID=1518452 RepID=A0A6A7G3F3_9CRUS